MTLLEMRLLSVAYASHFPVTSVDAVNELLNSTAPDGSPLAVFVDAGFYIRACLCPGPTIAKMMYRSRVI